MFTSVVSNGSSVTLIVRIVSQPPVVLDTVSIIVDGVANTCPWKVYGNSECDTSMFTSVVSNGSSVTLIVRIVSQPPVVLDTVSIIVDGVANTCPSKLYGNSEAHTSMFTSVVSNGSSVTLIVLIVSQPPVVDVTVSMIVPGVLKV